MRGVRIYSWSQFENKAFGGFYYEAKKKAVYHFTNLSSAWASLWPPVSAVDPTTCDPARTPHKGAAHGDSP